MPLIKSGSKAAISKNISEFHTGKTYAHTAAKFGKARANAQAIAAALSTARRYGKAEGGEIDKYTTKLSPSEESSFQSWKQQYAPHDSGEDYDLRGAYKSGLTPDRQTGHWPDTFKKPNHPTFSNQSIYAKDRPDLAGSWREDTYIPAKAEGGDVKPAMYMDTIRRYGRPNIQWHKDPLRMIKPNLNLDQSQGFVDNPNIGKEGTVEKRTSQSLASGGNLNMENMVLRSAARNLHSEGFIHSSVPGRTDKLPMSVPAGAYVLPSDIPSALGQGNSLAGGQILKKMFNSGPYGLPTMKGAGAPRQPRLNLTPPRRMKSMFQDGGDTGEDSGTVPIVAAGAEYIIPPEVVKDLGHGDLNAGHKVLDAFVLHTRSEHIKTLKKLPGPKKS